MYVDDDTTTDDTTATDTDAGQDELAVEIDGEEYAVEENYDMDGDGHNDTAVVQTESGEAMAFADTDGDGTADVAVQYDENGNVVAGAEYDESTGEWQAESVESLPTPTGDGADDATGSSDTDTGATDVSDTSTDTSTGGSSGGSSDGSMTVDLPGEDVDAGPATYDTDGDGTNDTSVVTDAEGTTYAFTDTDADGDADQAVIIEQDGDVTVAEHTGEDEWTVVEEGEISADGSYTPDSTSGSDAVWAER
ncbi:MAG TPA: DUF6802 family protein [Actinophytocola sp.]|nr:DUF6802 family protein [Actinophytocola sp.]